MKFSKIKLQMLKEKNFEYNFQKIKSATDIIKFINEYEQLDKATQESLILVCLNTKNQIVAYSEVCRGRSSFL